MKCSKIFTSHENLSIYNRKLYQQFLQFVKYKSNIYILALFTSQFFHIFICIQILDAYLMPYLISYNGTYERTL